MKRPNCGNNQLKERPLCISCDLTGVPENLQEAFKEEMRMQNEILPVDREVVMVECKLCFGTREDENFGWCFLFFYHTHEIYKYTIKGWKREGNFIPTFVYR